MSDAFFHTLAKEAASLYPARDRFARHFAAGKLKGDPAFAHLLRAQLVRPGARVLDLGCGQGMLAALLRAARERKERGDWDSSWPAPPAVQRYLGIELMATDVKRARHAAGPDGHATFVQGDIRTIEFGHADTVVILDVLHYVSYEEQDEILERVRASLSGGGVLLVRVGDESGSMRFRYTLFIDRLVMALRGHRLPRLYCRSLARWMATLKELGFEVVSTPMSEGTPFANVLLVARYHSHG
ncbi:MAG: class I SAM-dependent methyltransferase [Usitatibacter sp.]